MIVISIYFCPTLLPHKYSQISQLTQTLPNNNKKNKEKEQKLKEKIKKEKIQ